MRNRTRVNIIIAVVTLVLAAVIIIVCGVGSSWFTNSDIATWFDSWGKGDDIVVNDDDIQDDKPSIDDDKPIVSSDFAVNYGVDVSFTHDNVGELIIPAEGNVLFEVVGTPDYTVKVVSNIDDTLETGAASYYYLVDGKIGLFPNDDYTAEFIKYLSAPNFFYIDCGQGSYDLETLLKRMYGAESVTLRIPDGLEYPYKMIVTSAEGEEITILIKQA